MTLLATVAIAACGGSDSDGGDAISDQAHREYIAGCTDSGQNPAGCECLYTQLTTKQGIDTESEFKALIERVGAASGAAALPPEFRQASLACRSQLR